jgi:O-antigen/teichoic acid export membrane protein
METDTLEAEIVSEEEHDEGRASIAARLCGVVDLFPSATKGVFSIFDQALVSGTSFLTAAIVGRLTSPDQLGLYYVVLSMLLIISGVHEQVIGGPYSVLSKRRRGRELDEYSGSIWLHHLALTAMTIAILLAVIVLCLASGRLKVLPGLWALLGAAPLVLLRDGIRRFTYANLQVKWVIALDATVATIQIGGLLLLGYWWHLSLWSIYAVMGGACALASAGWYLLDPPHLQFNRHLFLPDWRHNWSFGKWALGSYMATGTTSYVMLWILWLTIEPSATAMLGACTTLVGVTNVILAGVANILTPLAAHAFATGGAKELLRILAGTAAFLAVVLGGFCLIALATGGWLVALVFGPHYGGTGGIFVTLAFAALMNGLAVVAGNGLWAIGQPRATFAADVCGTFAALIGAALLIEPFGVLGAALAIFSGACTAAIARTIILARHFADGPMRVNERYSMPIEET